MKATYSSTLLYYFMYAGLDLDINSCNEVGNPKKTFAVVGVEV